MKYSTRKVMHHWWEPSASRTLEAQQQNCISTCGIG